MATTVTQSAAAEKLTGYSYGSGREADPATNLTSVLTGFVSKKAGLCTGGRNHVRAGNDAVLHARGPEVLELQHGELLLSASKRTHVSIGTHRVEAAPGVIVHVVKFGDVLMVRNLCDASAKSVAVMIDGKAIHVRPGEELVLGPDGFTTDDTIKGDSIGRRNVDRFTVAGKHAVIRSEFSIVGLIQQSRLLTAMYTKGSPADRAVMERVMKMAAALFQITGKRGAYSAYVPSKVETIAVNPERKRLPH